MFSCALLSLFNYQVKNNIESLVFMSKLFILQ